MFIVIFGNLVDGHECAGPFVDDGEAEKWAQAKCRDTNWSILPLLTPIGFPKFVAQGE